MSPPDEPTAHTVVDPATLEGLRALRRPGQPDPVTRLVDVFRRETEARLEALRSAATRRDAREVERLAHAQKGSSGSVGANALFELARDLERQAISGDLDGIDEQVAA